MQAHDVGIALLALASETVGTISGFGSSTFFVPLAVLFESFKLVLALTAILHVFGNLSKLYLFKAKIPDRSVWWLMGFSIFFTGAGALLVGYLPTTVLKAILGAVLILLSLVFLFSGTRSPAVNKRFAPTLAALSGFFTGVVGTGGALRAVALTALCLEKETFVFVSSLIDFGGDLLRAGIYIEQGYMDWSQWYYLPMLAVAAFVGSVLGRKVIRFLNQQQFNRIVAIFILVTGVLLLGEAFA